jgi:hypothetical protein
MLRVVHPQYREMALYAANHWSDERLAAAEAAGDLPGQPAEVVTLRPLRLVSDDYAG